MMSKELKLGLGVGGALLAVLIVYVLVIPAKPEQGVDLVKTGDTTSAGIPTGTTGGSTDSSKPPVELVNGGALNGGGLANGGTSTKKDATKPDADNGDQVFGNAGDKPTVKSANASTAGDVWDCLNTGQVKLLATEKTPVNAGSPRTAPPTTPPVAPATGEQSPSSNGATGSPSNTRAGGTGSMSIPTTTPPADSTSRSIPPTTAPSNASSTVISPSASSGTGSASATTGKTTTHVVQAGETLAEISEAAYGSQAYWPHILRANPGLVAEKIRTGTTLIMPDPADVHPTRAAGPTTGPSSGALTSNTSAHVSADAPIDTKTQYRIASGDSLYRISIKLYGKGDQVEKIYELNKDVIGADPAKLKLGTILKLPQPPSVATVQ